MNEEYKDAGADNANTGGKYAGNVSCNLTTGEVTRKPEQIVFYKRSKAPHLTLSMDREVDTIVPEQKHTRTERYDLNTGRSWRFPIFDKKPKVSSFGLRDSLRSAGMALTAYFQAGNEGGKDEADVDFIYNELNRLGQAKKLYGAVVGSRLNPFNWVRGKKVKLLVGQPQTVTPGSFDRRELEAVLGEDAEHLANLEHEIMETGR